MSSKLPWNGDGRSRIEHSGGFLTLFLVFLYAAFAFTGSPASASTEAHNSLIVLLDVSGSMRQSDPLCLRYRATELLVSLLRDQDRFNLAEFGTRVRDLTGGFVLLDEQSRRWLGKVFEGCSQADRYTDIVAALDHALSMASTLPPESRLSYPVSVVLLTDGKDDVGATSDRKPLLEEKAKALSSLGVVVHGIGLSQSADLALLRKIADLTGGEVCAIELPQDLLKGFFGISRVLGKRWNLQDGPVSGGTLSLNVPAWAKRMILCFLPKRDGLRLAVATPATLAVNNQPKYQITKVETEGLTTLELLVPPPGGRLIVDAEGELALQAQIPATVPKGLPFLCKAKILPIQPVELGKPKFLTELALSIAWKGAGEEKTCFLYDDGDHGDSEAVDGLYAGYCVTSFPGKAEYRLVAAGALAPRLTHVGEVFAVDPPVSFQLPGLFERYLLAQGTGKLCLGVSNLTDVWLKGGLRFGTASREEAPSDVDLPAGASQPFSIHIKPAMWKMTRLDFALDLNGIAAVHSGNIYVGPKAPPIIAFLAGSFIFVLTFFFPRRSVQGMILKVEFRTNDCERIEILRIDKNGFPRNGTDLPDAILRPGRFRPRNGLWARGVVFEPSPGHKPQFKRNLPKRTKSGFLIQKGPAVWICRGAFGEVQYTLRPQP